MSGTQAIDPRGDGASKPPDGTARTYQAGVEFFLGPLMPFLRDETVTEIMVNGPRDVFVERAGRIEPGLVEAVIPAKGITHICQVRVQGAGGIIQCRKIIFIKAVIIDIILSGHGVYHSKINGQDGCRKGIFC